MKNILETIEDNVVELSASLILKRDASPCSPPLYRKIHQVNRGFTDPCPSNLAHFD